MPLNPVPQFTLMLKNLSRLLDKAQAYADQKKFDANVLLSGRLAPDMFPLVRQVQMTCDGAKSSAARLAGKDPPKHEDNEATFPELRERIAKVLSYLETFRPGDFAGAETRKIALPFLPGKHMVGADFLEQMAFPNFYFHLTTAYAILRNNGVDVGKMDYLGEVNFRDGV